MSVNGVQIDLFKQPPDQVELSVPKSIDQMEAKKMTELEGVNPRDSKVLYILKHASGPLGPTEIARCIWEPWCIKDGYPQSSAINPILKRIKAVRVGNGKYKMPETNNNEL